jgi:sigma-B regulation protein RsbU (phosphoserine phosphatase)
MLSSDRFTRFFDDLQKLEIGPSAAYGRVILDAFTRHTPFDTGAVYLRDGREAGMRLAAKSPRCLLPEILELDAPSELTTSHDWPAGPRPQVLVPIRNQRESMGMVALSKDDSLEASEEDFAVVRVAAAFLGSVVTNQKLLAEAREGDFQLKYRLWELESLYDIGLSMASTLNVDELADEILFRMVSLTNARRAALFLREGTQFRLYRSFGDVRADFLDEELAVQLVREGTPLSFEANSDCIFPDCSAYVALPIRNEDKVIGVLAAADRETREGGIGAFSENELRLLSLFASQVAIALENARLHREALEKQAMQREFELAATIQRDILPKSIPEVEGIELATLARPARQVGGDYHAFVEREGILTILVADVAGKSMPAALLVSALHAATQLLFADGRELGEVATELNKHIHRWSAENKFVTMIMISIDRENETMQFVNAGHNPGYVLSGGKLELLRSHGLPIGILPNSRYLVQTRPFPAGSLALLYSDGITEAENLADDEFGNDRLEAILRDYGHLPVTAIRDEVASAVDTFVGEAPQKDDMTMVVARLNRSVV